MEDMLVQNHFHVTIRTCQNNFNGGGLFLIFFFLQHIDFKVFFLIKKFIVCSRKNNNFWSIMFLFKFFYLFIRIESNLENFYYCFTIQQNKKLFFARYHRFSISCPSGTRPKIIFTFP